MSILLDSGSPQFIERILVYQFFDVWIRQTEVSDGGTDDEQSERLPKRWS